MLIREIIMRCVRLISFLALVGGALPACAGVGATASSAPVDPTAPPALGAITPDDMRRDLFALAGDEMRGREAGTLDELRASAWVADRARAAGLEPAGDDGTYFQFWPMRRTVTSRSSTVRIGERQARLGVDAYVIVPINASISGPVVWLDKGRDTTGLQQSLAGKIVALDLQPPTVVPAPGMSLWAFRYTNAAINESVVALAAKRVAAILIVSDSIGESQITGFFGQVLARGRYGIDSAGVAPAPINVPLVWLSRAYRNDLRAASTPVVSIAVDFDSYLYPSVNVVARVRGTDAALRDQHVLFSAHQDHDGVRAPVRGDSIYNGADDNATVSVALLAIGRAFARQPGRRSALFVWHGAEERGLLGSRWHAWHPVIPREQIVAVLNADMIGGNHPDTAGLLGVQPPHLNSRDLTRMALEANARVSRFVIDSTWDRPTHREFWYFRSDHVPYARHGIPSVYFSTLPHGLYHTPADDPASINIDKLTRVTRWMYATGWAASNSERRPDRLDGFKLER
jgi:hypothetical protein